MITLSTMKVGQPYAPMQGRSEGCYFDIDTAGARLIYHYRSPTEKELAAVREGRPFEIRFCELGGLIWITSKCGALPWNDAPYNPRTSALPDGFEEITAGHGLALLLAMIDFNTSVVQSLRLIGLGEDFSRKLIGTAARLREQVMTVREYRASMQNTMARYSSDGLSKMATARYKQRGGAPS